MSRWMRITLGIVAFIAWAILEAVAISANMRFAWSLGTTDLDRYILAAGGLASDLLKALIPLAILFFIAQRNWLGVAAGSAVGAVAIVFSTVAAIGFISTERSASYYSQVDKVKETRRQEAEIDRELTRRDWLPTHKPVSVLKVEQQALEMDARFKASKGCTAAMTSAIEIWCRTYREGMVKLASAEEAAKADARVEQVRSEIKTHGRTHGDAHIEWIAGVTGLKEKTVLFSLIGLSVLLIELGSVFGLTVALGLLVSEGNNTRIGNVIRVALGRTKPTLVKKEEAAVEIVPKPAVRVPRPDEIEPKAAASFDAPVTSTPDVTGSMRSWFQPVAREKLKSVA